MADSVASLFQLGTAENFNTGGWNGDIPSSLAGVFDTPWPFPDVGSSYDINRVVYLSPRFYGFDFGIDFAPSSNGLNGDNGDGCGSVQYSNPGIASGNGSIAGPGCDLLNSSSSTDYKRFRNEMNVGARYTGTFGDFGFSAYGDYLFSGVLADSTVPVVGSTSVYGPKGRQQYDGYSVGYGGIQGTFAGFTVGGAVMGGNINNVDTNQALMPVGTKKETAFVVGGSYTYGPVVVGVQYFNSWLAGNQTESNRIATETTVGVGGYNAYGVAAGGTYTVAPGLNLYLEYLYGQVKQPGYNLLLGAVNSPTLPNLKDKLQTSYLGVGSVLSW
jgi:predicted porin